MEGNVAQNKTNARRSLTPRCGLRNVAELVPPEIRHRNRQTQIEISTLHRSGRKTGSSELWENHDRRQE